MLNLRIIPTSEKILITIQVSFLKNEIWKVTDADKDNNGDDKYLSKRTVKEK